MDEEKSSTITASPSVPGAKTSLYMGLAVRQIGRSPRCNALPLTFEAAAEDQLVHQKIYADTKCSLPANTRSTFLMVFSPDGKLVASTHGDHCVYVCDVATGACVRTLSGHPRTPWCLAFHPTSSQLLASGCLGGQVRVWDLSGGSEVWCAEEQTVIASLAFHPSSDRLLVIATYNELLFWDWSKPKPFAKCSTRNEKEKVRFVTFDPLGHKLITGIANRWTPPSQWDQQPTTSSSTFYSRPSTSTSQPGLVMSVTIQDFTRRNPEETVRERPVPPSNAAGPSGGAGATAAAAAAGGSGAASWEWTTPFSNLLQEYESLVQRCRQRLGNERPPPGRVDRGTNTQEPSTSTAAQQETTPPTFPSLQAAANRAGLRAPPSRLNTYMRCIASLEDHMATTNIERLRNPLLRDPPSSTATNANSSSRSAGLTIPCSVNLGERVSEERLRRLREMWRAGVSTATTSRETTDREGPTRNRRRRRHACSFDHRRETKRLKTNSDQQKRDSSNKSSTESSKKESKRKPKEKSDEASTSNNQAASTSNETQSDLPSTSSTSGEPISDGAGPSIDRSSIYDDPQPGTSQSAREPEVIMILSDSDSSSDTSEPTIQLNPPPSVPLIDLTSTEDRQTSAYMNRLERQMRIIRLLNSPFRRSHPRTPGFLQTSQQSAFRPQAPRGSGRGGATASQSSRTTPTVPRFLRASADLGVRYAIRMLSRHIDMMERRCRARLEILQLEQIRRLWEDFMTQLTSLNSSLSLSTSRADGTTPPPPRHSRRSRSQDEPMWTRRNNSRESREQPAERPGTSSMPPADEADSSALAAIEEAYRQISNEAELEEEEIILLESPPGGNLSGGASDPPEANNISEGRSSMSGQVPEDAPPEDVTIEANNVANNSRGSIPEDAQRADGPSTASNESAGSSSQANRTGDSSEEYHSTLLRANQIAVLRRLLTLLERNDFPFDVEVPRVGSVHSRLRGYASSSNQRNSRDPEPVSTTPRTPGDQDPSSNSQQTVADPPPPRRARDGNVDRPPRLPRTGRGSPTEFLEELRSIQQSIVQRYDQMSLEIPSQEAMQRDLDRIVNLEAAVRERLRLSEDNFERSLLENREGGRPTPGSPWSRDPPLRRRLDPGDPALVYWGPDLPPARSYPDDFNSSSAVGTPPTFHMRLSQPYFFRPPPEPQLMPLLDERPEARRDGEPGDEWHQNASLLQTTRRQAWRVLGLMVRHVRQHIELHQLERYSEGSSLQAHLQQLLSLLHRALELTDTLLTQMLATRREMEQQWRIRMRAAPPERTPRHFRHVWHPLERVEYFPSSASSSSFSHSLAAWRDRETAAAGMYAQEMHRRGLSDTDPNVVNHLIQHFQRRTPEPSEPTSEPPAPATENITATVAATESTANRSRELRERLGGLWSCRRSPASETQAARTEPSVSVPSTSSNIEEPSTSNTAPPPVNQVPRNRPPRGNPTEDVPQPEVPPTLYDNIRSRYNRVCTILDRLTQLDPSPQFRSWADNLRRLLEMPQRYFEAEDERQRSERQQSAFNVPTVRVNDVPIPDTAVLNQQRRGPPAQPTSPPLWTRRRAEEEQPANGRSRSPSPVVGRVRAGAWRSWMYYPRNRGVPNSARDLFGASHQATMEGVRGAAATCPTTLTHRIQCWPFLEGEVPPDICNPQRCLVVGSCRINNDASVDVSRDGRLLVALVPSPRPGGNSKLGVYSLEASTLGQMLFSTPLEQSPVSVSLSPSSRFLLVGLATKRFLTARGESSPAAQVFRLPWERGAGKDRDTATTLEPSRFIYQTSETGYVSINCIRWAPVSGQGMVYGTNTGSLGILR